MASPGSSARDTAAQNAMSITGMVGDWIRQGTEGFIATQKILLDLAAQQNALALTIARERLGLISLTPSKAVVDLSSKSVHNFMEAQQTMLDIVSKENDIIFEGLKPGVEKTVVEGLAEVVHEGLSNCVVAQKQFLSIVEAEAEGAIKDYGDGKSFETGRLKEVAREGVRTFVTTQKKFLEVVEQELVDKSEEPRRGSKPGKPVNVLEMTKDSVDAFVETQKRLLDIASDQINVNVKFVREFLNTDVQRRPATSLPDVLKKSADSFVAAQKALVELASKPRKPGEKMKGEHEMAGAKA